MCVCTHVYAYERDPLWPVCTGYECTVLPTLPLLPKLGPHYAINKDQYPPHLSAPFS